MSTEKVIKISCDVKLFQPFENLNEFQGTLKSRADKNKLKKQILDQGFSAPIFVWKKDGKYFILDGHGRKEVCAELRAEGYTVPDLPCVEIFAKSKKEAKLKLLGYVSAFGKVEGKGLYEFIMEAELSVEELEEFAIPEINMEEFKKEFFSDVAEVPFPEMPDSDKPDIEQMTFLLHKDQVNEVRRAMDVAKSLGEYGETGNENSNGNALARIAELFLQEYDKQDG